MKFGLMVFAVTIALIGCAGTGTETSGSQSVLGKWEFDPGLSLGTPPPPPAPPVVEFRADGTYEYRFADAILESTYTVADGMLLTDDGIGFDRKEFVISNNNTGTLRLTEIGPPPATTSYWRRIN